MSKPKVITKTELRKNIALYTDAIATNINSEPLWITDTGKVQTVLVNADQYAKMQEQIQAVKKAQFIANTLDALADYKKGKNFKSYPNIKSFLTDLDIGENKNNQQNSSI